MAAQAGLTLGLVLALQLVRDVLHDLGIGIDALGLDRAAGRRVVPCRRQPDGAVAAERNDGLDGALAERAGAENRRALVVLQGAGDDLRGRGRTAVDEDDQRLALGEVAGLRVEALRILSVAAAGRDDLAAVEERVRHHDGLVEQAARVVAQVDDEARQLVGADIRGQLLDAAAKALIGLLVELGDPQDTDIALDPGAHRDGP